MKRTKTTLVLVLTLCLFSFATLAPKPRIFLVGDSTLADKKPEVAPETGWGTVFKSYINLEVRNHAVNGRSTRSFRTLGHWKTVAEQLQPGDWVFIQFGHNDSKESDTSRYAAADTDYRKNLTRYVQEIRAKGAKPVLITPVMRRKFDASGNFVDQHGDYPRVVKEVAKSLQVPVIDLHAKSKTILVAQGVEDSKQLFLNLDKHVWKGHAEGKDDNTHFTPYGAALMAKAVAEEIRDLKLELAGNLTTLPVGKYVYELPHIAEVSFRKDTFNITAFGAKPDGITLNSKNIQSAIDSCHRAGGGTVVIPAGLWLTGPLTLRSHVNLHVATDAVLQFSSNTNDYALLKTNWEGVEAIRAQSPIYAEDAVNIAITGGGTLDGAGQVWRPVKKSKLTPPEWEQRVASGGVLNDNKDTWYPTERALLGSKAKRPGVIAEGYDLEKAAAIKEFLRPNMVSLVRCKRVLLEGVTFQNSPAWCLHPLLTQHLVLRNLTVRNPWNAQNGDGVDIESCRNVLVENSTFDVGDDGICIKSGRDEEGRKRGVPTEDVVVRHCTVFHGHGGFVVGSEMSGGARNIFVSDCNFLGTDVGLRFKTTRGRGGIVEKIYVDNIRMTNIGGAAILFDMYYMAKDPLAVFSGEDKPSIEFQPVNEGTPQFRDITIRGVACKGAETAIFVRGLPEMNIARIALEDIVVESKHGLVCTEGDAVSLKNATLYCDDEIVVDLQDSKNVVLDNVHYKPGKTFLSVKGGRSKDVRLLNATVATNEIKLGPGLSDKIIKRK
ncbi:glycosyl hydrolase family 28 protein [Chryseolinea lacunae]|uniref:Right-handed parallel beta-helix repeat-containing protein n=1 Tax=Chryseolinea lacunae TaxID=2801331 RepID=A0ABS1KQL2_9BACT|nr:glycosyl hydrolase family 28 protein [Chryseolinea lacunae]MBL0740977.1 right-handed parallel beta-helix repeat-containing protein [Chryseolinea lacunae]